MGGAGTAVPAVGGTTSRDQICDEGCVPPDAADEVGAAAVLEPLTEDVEPGHRRAAAAVPDLAVPVEHRQLQPGVRPAIAGGPHHVADTRRTQIEGPDDSGHGDGSARLRGEYLGGQPVRLDVVLDTGEEPAHAPLTVGDS